VELTPLAGAFEQRQEARLVGRKRELAALRRIVRRSADGSEVRVAVVVGLPGLGKSRLAAELAGRTKGNTALWGRCLSYGEGITYWPLREVLEHADQSDERDAVLDALDAETPPPAPEIAWRFRQFCEACARARPLLLVFDDLHWAEPTFLELVEALADKGAGPITVVCIAREELLDERPAFLEGRTNASRIVLDALSAEETDALLDGLGGTVLESDQRGRIAEAAEGNPLFVEQLLALALEGGLAERPLPETIQALLAARLDRLGPGERAVLERGAVVGKEFAAGDVLALLDPDAAPTVDSHLDTLVGRGFVWPRGEGAFGFRHVLVQDAVYRAAPKRLRAELHERYADRLDTESPDLPDLDEFVGYHLERAYRLRTELGESDRRTERLAEDGGRRLGEAGVRGLKRGDMPATVNLLQRATSLLPEEDTLRSELLCELGIALRTSGESGAAVDVLTETIVKSEKRADRRIELRARIEHEYVRFLQEPGTTADALLDATAAGIPIFETIGDHRSLGRAWLLSGFVLGAQRGHHEAGRDATERALFHYASSQWPTSTCLGQIAIALYYGPTPVSEAIDRCNALLDAVSDRAGRANVQVFMGGLVAQRGDLDAARDLVSSARAAYEDLGQLISTAIYATAMLGEIALLARESAVAEQVLRGLCAELERMHELSHLASRAGDLSEALYTQGQLGEAEEWTVVAERHTATDDLDAKLAWMPVRAKIAARQGGLEEAEKLARDAIGLACSSDAPNRHAKAQLDLGEILSLAGRAGEARAAFGQALKLFEEKGNLVGAEHARSLMGVALV
jgi:hypothetical protein